MPAGGPEEPPAAVPRPELKRRADIMFSGVSGAVVASGDGGITTAPTYGLVQDVISVVKELPPELFDPNAEHRPCGLLDKYDAAGMLICDVIGLPLPYWTLAKPIGKAAAKLPAKIAAAQGKEKKRAGRAGKDPAEAAAAVLRWRVALELPTAADIAAAWKQLGKEAAKPPAAAPAAAAEAQAEATTARRVHALEAMWGSQAAMDAIEAAEDIERLERLCLEADMGYVDCDTDEPYDKEAFLKELDAARLEYTCALQRLKAAFPEELNDCSEDGACEHRRPCPCGRGQRGAWPWVVQTPARGFCELSDEDRHEFTERGLWSCTELSEERERWVWMLEWGSKERRARLMFAGGEARYWREHEALRRELYCLP